MSLGDRAGLGDLRGHARDAPDLVLGDNRAARESPHAAVNHADAEARRAARRRAAAATESAKPAAATTAAAATAPAATATAAAEAADAFEVAVAAAGVDAAVDVAREADVRVGAALRLRLEERDVRQALELRLEHLALRRLRDQISDDVAGGDGDAGDRHGPYKVSALHFLSSRAAALGNLAHPSGRATGRIDHAHHDLARNFSSASAVRPLATPTSCKSLRSAPAARAPCPGRRRPRRCGSAPAFRSP